MPLTSNLNQQKTKNPGSRVPDSKFSVFFYSSIDEVPRDWDEVAPPHNVFLSRHYLSVLEQNPPKEMDFGYVLFYNKRKAIGQAIFQLSKFSADESIQENDELKYGEDICFFQSFARLLKGLVKSKVGFTTMVCGNLLVTGEHGFYFNPKYVNSQQEFELLHHGILTAQKAFDAQGKNVDVVFLKDYFEDKKNNAEFLLKNGYYEFSVQPNMVFNISDSWNSFDDYLADLSSKYRVRAKRAFKKSQGLIKRELSLDQIELYNDELFKLYNYVAQNAGFNLIELDKHYLTALKRDLGDRFKLIGYYLEGELIGFFTTIDNEEDLEAHFLGYNPEFNRSHQIYLNMLYDIIQIGIDTNSKTIQYARTAMEIKSSVGAVPHDMYCYIRHRNSFANKFMKPLLNYLNPDDAWEPRQPFKEQASK